MRTLLTFVRLFGSHYLDADLGRPLENYGVSYGVNFLMLPGMAAKFKIKGTYSCDYMTLQFKITLITNLISLLK